MMDSLLNLCVNIHNNLMIAFDASQPVDNEYQENYKEIFQVQFGIGKAVIMEPKGMWCRKEAVLTFINES